MHNRCSAFLFNQRKARLLRVVLFNSATTVASNLLLLLSLLLAIAAWLLWLLLALLAFFFRCHLCCLWPVHLDRPWNLCLATCPMLAELVLRSNLCLTAHMKGCNREQKNSWKSQSAKVAHVASPVRPAPLCGCRTSHPAPQVGR